MRKMEIISTQYHIRLKPVDIAPYVLLPEDPVSIGFARNAIK